jgi:hypothetical protein
MFTALTTDEAHMSSSRLIRRLLRRRGAAPSTQPPTSRLEVRPPALWGQAEPMWLSLWHWLRQSPGAEPRRMHTLDLARTDFGEALSDLGSRAALDLRARAEHARSLRELWHLRAELYGVIARDLNQIEADRRLARVNRHFPVGAHGTSSNAVGSRHGQSHDL